MMAPPLLVAAALLAWGSAGNSLPLAAILAAGFELARAAGPRDNPLRGRERTVIRIALVAGVALFVGAGITQKFPGAIYLALRGLPLVLLPVAVMQVLSERRAIALWGQVDATHLLAASALVGAAATDPNARWFYVAAAAIVGWALLARVPRRLPAAALFAVAAALGFAIHTGLSTLQSRLEDWSTELLQDLLSAGADPFRERTRIGDMGRIKLSDRIALRAIPEGTRPTQVLLREAAFDTYVNGEWRALRRTFSPRTPADGAWQLGGAGSQALAIRRSAPRNEGVLALPAGTTRLSGLAGATLATLPTGAVRVQSLPSFIALRVEYDPAADFAAAPSPADLEVPELLRPALEQVLVEGKITRGAGRETEAAIRAFFAQHYGYSLTLSDGRGGNRTLRDFLLTDRKGHCEYFATASALLLRQAGVPARYTVGYSAQEFSPLEKAFVVRDRHAHAWTSAWVDGRWVEVDNTPSRWAEFEQEEARAWYGPALDLFSWAWDAFRRNVLEAEWDATRIAGLVLAAAVVLASAWWLHRRRPWRRSAAREAPHPATISWRRVESALASRGFVRGPGETPRAFAERLEASAPACEGLVQVARRYYAARFDPASSPADTEGFARDVERWLARA
jgi:protein-glutamine gamma-glutamyltransferase